MAQLLKEPFSGYYHRDVPEPDKELTEVGPGTPCGEYLRRFWHPVAMTAELKDLPKRIRIMGEDLVLLLIATAAVMDVTRADAPEAWRRFVALALDSFSTHRSPPRSDSALPDPPSTAQMTRAMIRLARERGCGERA